MGYELNLRRAGDHVLDASLFEGRLASGRRVGDGWKFENPKHLAVKAVRDDKGLVGFDLDVPFGGAEKDLRAAAAFALALAEGVPATVFDPQLGRTVSKGSEDEIVAAWRRVAAWQVDVAGTIEDVGSNRPVEPPKPMIDKRMRTLLIVVGAGIVVIWILASAISSLVAGAGP